MASIIYNDSPGSLPFTIEFTPEDDRPVTLYLTGSAYAVVENVNVGISLEIAGDYVSTAQIFSNGTSTHRAMVPKVTAYHFPFNVVNGVVQPVSVTFFALDKNTIFDANDSITLMAI